MAPEPNQSATEILRRIEQILNQQSTWLQAVDQNLQNIETSQKRQTSFLLWCCCAAQLIALVAFLQLLGIIISVVGT